MKWYKFEKDFKLKGFKNICGIDEAGRGPLAGPVVAAAVILKEKLPIEGVDDSKSISCKKRERLYELIKNSCKSFCITEVSSKKIDEINILNATFLAMKKAVWGLKIKPDILLIDGNLFPKFDIFSKCVIKGDTLSSSIAAASILAKVHRDRLMLKMDKIYPEYGFLKNKGYGTKFHREILKSKGACPIHRKSFKLV